jgi:hypothetical protein
MKEALKEVFNKLDVWITEQNREREQEGSVRIGKCEIKLLGQMSLMAQEKVAAVLHLFQTRDVDAKLEKMDHAVKQKLVSLLAAKRLVYDEDSHLVWIPKGSKFETLFDYKNFSVTVIDPESALVSKAVKAKEKNKQLIQDAIESDLFPGLVDRIIEHGGDLKYFME